MGLFDILTESGRIYRWLYDNYFRATEIAYRVMLGGGFGTLSSASLTEDIPIEYKRRLASISDEIMQIELYLKEKDRKMEIAEAASKYKRAFLYFCKIERVSPSFFVDTQGYVPTMPGRQEFKSFSKSNQKNEYDHDDLFQELVTKALQRYGYSPKIPSPHRTLGIGIPPIFKGIPGLFPQMSPNELYPYGISMDWDHNITVKPFSDDVRVKSLYQHLSDFESMDAKLTELVTRESLWKQFEDCILSHKFASKYYRGYFKETYGTENVSLDKYEALVKNVDPLNAYIQKKEQDYDYLRKQYPFGIKEFEKRHPEIPHAEYMTHADTIAWFSKQSMIVLFPERQNDLSERLVKAVSNLLGWGAKTQSTKASYHDYDDRKQEASVSCPFIYRYLTYNDDDSSIDKSCFGFCSDIFDNNAVVKSLGYKAILDELNTVLSVILPVYFDRFTRVRIVLASDLWDLLEDHGRAQGQIRCLPAMEEFDLKTDVLTSFEFYLNGPSPNVPHIFLKLNTAYSPLNKTYFWDALPCHVLSSVVSIALSLNSPELAQIEENRKQKHRAHQLEELRSLQRDYPFGFRQWCINRFGFVDINALPYDKVIGGKREIIHLQQMEEKRQQEERRIEAEKQEIQKALRIFNNYPSAFKELFPNIREVSSLSDAKAVIQAEGRARDFDSIYCRRADLFEHQRMVCGLPHKYFYDYYSKKKYGDGVTPEADSNRRLIWAFKDGVLQQRVVSLVVDFLKASKIASFGGRITFACIPASDPITNRGRYEWFSEEVCKNLGFRNAFEHIRVCSSVTPRRMGGTRLAELDIDRDFFKDSFVLLFDDIVTQGITAANRKSLIEAAGGRCIGIISLGRTV